MHWIALDVNPEPWAMGPVGVARRGGKIQPYVGRNAQLAEYQAAVKEELGEQEMLEGKIVLRFFFWRNRADYVTPQARTHRKHEADLTNLQKATEDALQGVLFKNDKDVADIHSTMVAQGPNITGRIILGIKPFTGADTTDLEGLGLLRLVKAMDEKEHTKFSDNSWPPAGF